MSLAWIPNVFTLGNLFFGFAAMLAALRGRFDLSALFIFICMLFDMLDGRIARVLKSDSPIGKELDSFADMLSFGVAPGVIFYAAFLGNEPIYRDLAPIVSQMDYIRYYTEYNWIHLLFAALSFLFPLAAVIRLARFNISESDEKNFSGCPTTTAGGFVVVLTCFSEIPSLAFMAPYNFKLPSALLIILFLFVALLMIIKIPFPKPQTTLFRKSCLSQPLLLVYNLAIVAALVLCFKHFLLLAGSAYILWSLVRGTLFARK
jgi:CDP-diacylglycerol--serine O-phosphatidyltransferase